MLLADVLIRYPAIGLLTLFGVLALRDRRRTTPALYAALTCFSVTALLLGTPPPVLELPGPAHVAARLADIPNIVFIWWLGRSMFEDDFRLGRVEWAAFAAYTGLVLIVRLENLGAPVELPAPFHVAIDGLSLGMMAQLAWSTLRGRADDMVEARRSGRLYFVLALAAVTAATVVAETATAGAYEAQLTLLRASVALGLVVWAFLWIGRLDADALAFRAVDAAGGTRGIDPKDRALYDRLLAAMRDERAYAEPGLTIGALAERLKTPEHRLRALINQGLGHRNFSAFLNAFRIPAAKAALADPERARTPVLTIALDTGFGSLAPFNRAFKAETGQTPSEFRKRALAADRG